MSRNPLVVLVTLAVASVAHAGETAKDWIEWSRKRAVELESWGEYENACDEWRNVARLDMKDVGALANAAVLAVDIPTYRGKDLKPGSVEFTVADTCVTSAMTRGGQGNAALAYAIGRMRCAEGRWGSAWRMLGESKRDGFEPIRVRYWYYRASVNRAAELIDVGRAEEAVMALEALLAEQPTHPDDHHARYLLAAGHDAMSAPEVAKQMLGDLLKKEPESSDCHFLLGLILAKQGLLDEAEVQFRETMQISYAREVQTYRNAKMKLCDLLLKCGRIAEAEKVVNELMEEMKDSPEVLYRLGRVRQAQQRLEEAILLFRRVKRRLPGDIETLQNLQQTLYAVGETEEAEAVGREIQRIRTGRDPDGTLERPVPKAQNAPGEVKPAEKKDDEKKDDEKKDEPKQDK